MLIEAVSKPAISLLENLRKNEQLAMNSEQLAVNN
jgi:hypothetical protein